MAKNRSDSKFSGAARYVLDEELAQIVNISMVLEMPLLLKGEPGTGKTMLGRAAASLANVQFMAVSGPDFLSKWVGESERAVRELFQRAEELAPVVLFFDEFDAVGRNRDNSEGAHHSSSVVAQLLTMMDGLKPADGIYLMASTNKIELVDEAFLRPGRFSKSIEVGPLASGFFLEFFQSQIGEISSTISNQEWMNTVLRLRDKSCKDQYQLCYWVVS